jgi:hypothetical protein
MKKVITTPLGLLFILLVVASCKEKSVSNDEKVTTDSTKVSTEANEKNIGKVDLSISADSIKKMSLYQLINEYEKASKAQDTNQYAGYKIYLDLITKSIIDKHVISKIEYEKYRDDFWGTSKVYEHPINKSELDAIVDSANDTNFIQYTFTDKKVANDFNRQIVKNHVFNDYVSCFTAILFKKIANDPNFQSLAITKGLKTLTRTATCPYEGEFKVALLIYKDKNTTQFLDIVEDPTN